MKKIFLSLSVLVLLTTSCSKEKVSDLVDPVAVASRSSDDSSGDDHGGDVGGGGGQKIAASKVPAAVMSTYKSKYPAATNPQWKKLDNGNYKVEFFVNGVKWQSIFSPAGVLLKQERH